MPSKSVLFVCLGNICRSPLAEGIFTDLVHTNGLSKHFVIDSCGTGSWHVGSPPHEETIDVAHDNGIDIEHLHARQLTKNDFSKFSLLVAMDEDNLAVMNRLGGKSDARLCLLREYDPKKGSLSVPDPYYDGGFEGVFQIIDRCCQVLFAELSQDILR